jgi:hypothetical protein
MLLRGDEQALGLEIDRQVVEPAFDVSQRDVADELGRRLALCLHR